MICLQVLLGNSPPPVNEVSTELYFDDYELLYMIPGPPAYVGEKYEKQLDPVKTGRYLAVQRQADYGQAILEVAEVEVDALL